MRTIRMFGEIERSGKRVVEAELGVHRLSHLVGRSHLVSSAIDAGREARCEENDGPIPVENLRAEDQQENRAAEREDGRKGGFVDEQIAHLTPTSAADQVRKRAVLTHLLIIPEKQVSRIACDLSDAASLAAKPATTRNKKRETRTQHMNRTPNCAWKGVPIWKLFVS